MLKIAQVSYIGYSKLYRNVYEGIKRLASDVLKYTSNRESRRQIQTNSVSTADFSCRVSVDALILIILAVWGVILFH